MSTPAGRAFDRVVVIMFENECRSYVMRNPYMRWLASQGMDMATYFGVMHPSNTNYTASMAGEICNITEDPHYYTLMPGSPPVVPPSPLDQTPIVDRIRAKGLDWKGYMESYQPVEFPPSTNVVMREEDTASLTVAVATEAAADSAGKTINSKASDVPPDVAITISGPATVTPGQNVTFDITVFNGGSFAYNVVVDCPTPVPLTLVSINGKTTSTFPYTTSMLYPGQPSTLAAVYAVPADFSGSFTLNATVSAVNQPATVRQTILDYPPYLNIHNPFVQFKSILEDRLQWERIGTANDFLRDALNGTLPEYSWFTPDIWSDGHWIWGTYDEADERGMVLVDQLAKWLKTFFEILGLPGPTSRLPPRTLVVVTFDEADYDVSWETFEEFDGTYDGPNQIYTVLLGDMIEPGKTEGEGYNHYSLLKTVEQNFGLESLGKNDAAANWFQFLWKREFQWSAPSETPIAAAAFVAAAGFAKALYVVYGDGNAVACRTFTDGAWSEETSVPAPPGTTAVALAACDDQLVLVCNAGGTLSALTFAGGVGWSQAQAIATDAAAFGLTAFFDCGAGTEKLMLAWRTTANAIQSQTYSAKAWATAVNVGQQTDGDLTVAALGASLFLIHKTVGSDEMSVISYNTAPFNVVTTDDGDNDATLGLWSPSEFPVAHFGYAPSRATPGNPEPLTHPYQSVGPFASATLDGVIHLAYAGVHDAQVRAARFSLSGILTPANEVSYKSDSAGISNGYGTLAEAGWTRQLPIAGVRNGGAMAMGRCEEQLALVFQPAAGGAVQMSLGAYS
jgi:phosphoesterase family protein/uncharacterized protein DUF11